MHGLMSGDGKRGYTLPRPSSTLRVGQFSAHSVAGKDYMKLEFHKNMIMVRMLRKPSFILTLCIFPEVKYFIKLKLRLCRDRSG